MLIFMNTKIPFPVKGLLHTLSNNAGDQWEKFRGSQWAQHNPEEHEDFKSYLDKDPLYPRVRRSTILLLIDDAITPSYEEIEKLSVKVIEAYLCLPVKLHSFPINTLSPDSYREKQLRTQKGMDLLYDFFDDKTFAGIFITDKDLCPKDNANFVFGEACADSRRAIVSTHRLSLKEPLGIERFIKILSHEAMHLLDLNHCTKWECNMNGKYSLEEVDSDTPMLCPDCLAKLSYAVDVVPDNLLSSISDLFDFYSLKHNSSLFKRFSALVTPNEILKKSLGAL